MHFNFTGDFIAKKPRREVYEFLTDAERFCPVLPDFKSLKIDDPEHFTVTLSVGISHIRGDAKLKLTLAEAVPPARARYVGKGDAVGGMVTIAAEFDLEDAPEGTKVLWKGHSQIAGRLPSLAGGLLEPLAKKNLMRLIDGLQAALVGEPKEPVRA